MWQCLLIKPSKQLILFFFMDPVTSDIYTLSLHDALPISPRRPISPVPTRTGSWSSARSRTGASATDRKSTRLNSSHANISYAVFCLKKKNQYADWFPHHCIVRVLRSQAKNDEKPLCLKLS